jgi:hypothetical protein
MAYVPVTPAGMAVIDLKKITAHDLPKLQILHSLSLTQQPSWARHVFDHWPI